MALERPARASGPLSAFMVRILSAMRSSASSQDAGSRTPSLRISGVVSLSGRSRKPVPNFPYTQRLPLLTVLAVWVPTFTTLLPFTLRSRVQPQPQ